MLFVSIFVIVFVFVKIMCHYRPLSHGIARMTKTNVVTLHSNSKKRSLTYWYNTKTQRIGNLNSRSRMESFTALMLSSIAFWRRESFSA